MKFTVTMEITHKDDRGDTIVAGNAEVEWIEGNRGQVRRVTAGDDSSAFGRQIISQEIDICRSGPSA